MNTEHLKKLILQGHTVAVENKNKQWVAFSNVGKEWFYATIPTDSVEKSVALLDGLTDHYNLKEIRNEFTDNYKVVTLAPLLLEKGDKVELLSNYEELINTSEYSKFAIDKLLSWIGKKDLKIEDVFCFYYYITDGDYSYSFPHWAVAFVEEEKPIETNQIGENKYSKVEFEEATKNLKIIN